MTDPLTDSTTLLARLVREASKETDPAKYDELAAQIQSALDARELLKQALRVKGHVIR
jgi:hypothetical protein